jgi:hypothetical protein
MTNKKWAHFARKKEGSDIFGTANASVPILLKPTHDRLIFIESRKVEVISEQPRIWKATVRQ